VRTALKQRARVPDLRDHDSLGSFCDLVEKVTGPNEHTSLLRTLSRQEAAQRIGVT
jgi:hypothetical protein